MKKLLKRIGILLLLVIIFIYLNNSSILVFDTNTRPLLLAHRGMAQTFSMEGIESDTCTAGRIFDPEHPYLENTIPSMEAAFQAGADVVEFDIHPTTDGEFAVFHDWILECRTDGSGVTREHSMEELKKLDVGYGYTADNGKTYPFRGKGIGLMPTMGEVLTHFPQKSFLIHIKSDDPNEGELLAQYLKALKVEDFSNLTVYGGDQPIKVLKEQLPTIRVMSKETLKSCLLPYIAIGWTGYVPSSCVNTQVHLPEKIAKFMWGWPYEFVNRMEKSGTNVVVVAGSGGFSEGFDEVEDLDRISEKYSGYIWTNRIDRIAPIIKGNTK